MKSYCSSGWANSEHCQNWIGLSGGWWSRQMAYNKYHWPSSRPASAALHPRLRRPSRSGSSITSSPAYSSGWTAHQCQSFFVRLEIGFWIAGADSCRWRRCFSLRLFDHQGSQVEYCMIAPVKRASSSREAMACFGWIHPLAATAEKLASHRARF